MDIPMTCALRQPKWSISPSVSPAIRSVLYSAASSGVWLLPTPLCVSLVELSNSPQPVPVLGFRMHLTPSSTPVGERRRAPSAGGSGNYTSQQHPQHPGDATAGCGFAYTAMLRSAWSVGQ